MMLEGGHHPALGLDRGEPGQASVLHQLQRGKVRRPGPGPHGPRLVPQLPGSLGLARVMGLDRGPEQLAVFGGQAGGGLPRSGRRAGRGWTAVARSRCRRRRPGPGRDRGRPGRSTCRMARRYRSAPGRGPAGRGPRSAAVRRPARRRGCRSRSSRSPPALQHGPGHRQSAASKSASRSAARCRICGDGVISGLGGCKIASLPGPGQVGNAGPRSP